MPDLQKVEIPLMVGGWENFLINEEKKLGFEVSQKIVSKEISILNFIRQELPRLVNKKYEPLEYHPIDTFILNNPKVKAMKESPGETL